MPLLVPDLVSASPLRVRELALRRGGRPLRAVARLAGARVGPTASAVA